MDKKTMDEKDELLSAVKRATDAALNDIIKEGNRLLIKHMKQYVAELEKGNMIVPAEEFIELLQVSIRIDAAKFAADVNKNEIASLTGEDDKGDEDNGGVLN